MTYAKFDKLTKRLAKNIESAKKQAHNFKGDVFEIIADENGKELSRSIYPFSHLSAVGERFVMKAKQYTVVSCVKTGNEIITIVK